MQFVVKFACIAAIFVFASCHNDVPELPPSEEVKFCKYEVEGGNVLCKSTYEVSEDDCNALKEQGKAELFSDKNCKVPL